MKALPPYAVDQEKLAENLRDLADAIDDGETGLKRSVSTADFDADRSATYATVELTYLVPESRPELLRVVELEDDYVDDQDDNVDEWGEVTRDDVDALFDSDDDPDRKPARWERRLSRALQSHNSR